jgi:hypothetical protein
MTKKERAKLIERGIRLTYDSLQSHLRYTYERHRDSASHHIKSVREYAELIQILTKLY